MRQHFQDDGQVWVVNYGLHVMYTKRVHPLDHLHRPTGRSEKASHISLSVAEVWQKSG